MDELGNWFKDVLLIEIEDKDDEEMLEESCLIGSYMGPQNPSLYN